MPVDFGGAVTRELHHFSDASTQGYSQCSYLSHVNEAGDIHCTLIMGKATVASIKVTTIPRLQLTAAVAASNTFKEELGLAVTDVSPLLRSCA